MFNRFTVYLFVVILLTVSACGQSKGHHYPKQKPSNQSISKPHSFDRYGRQQEEPKVKNPLGAANTEHHIALLVPLSGPSSAAGQSLFDAAQMAIFNSKRPNIAVVPYDTQGSPEGATEAAYTAIENNASLIVGPLFASSVRKVAPIARSAKIKVIAFSNDKSVAGNGVYIMGFIPEQQIHRLVEFAAKKGIEGVSSMLPNDIFGHEVKRAIQRQASWSNVKVRGAALYSASKPNLTVVSNQVVKNYGKAGVAVSTDKEMMVIPEGGEKLQRAIIALQQKGITYDDVRFAGTSLWDNDDTLSLPEVDNAWYVSVPYKAVERFNRNFRRNFGYRPLPVASLAYDAVKLAEEISYQDFKESAITDKQGFYGVNGAYRFNSKGINERSYEIMEVFDGDILVVDQASGGF